MRRKRLGCMWVHSREVICVWHKHLAGPPRLNLGMSLVLIMQLSLGLIRPIDHAHEFFVRKWLIAVVSVDFLREAEIPLRLGKLGPQRSVDPQLIHSFRVSRMRDEPSSL